jgi:hypothetical protein
MRRNLLAGLCLAVAAGLLVLVGAALDLDLESVALLGAAAGAVVALVPDRTPLVRLGGFAAGVLAAFIGYVLRAAVLPDTSTGRAVAVVIVLLLCVGVAAATVDRLPLWTLLLGTATFVGAYEFTFAAAPPELMTTSLDTATGLFLSLAVGFFVALLANPVDTRRADPSASDQRDDTTPDGDSDRARLNDMMETSK